MGAILTCGASSCELFGMQFHTQSVSPGSDPFQTDGSGLDSMDYQQKYIPDEYLELRIPAGLGGDGIRVFKMDPGHLHIWPRHSFMLIALPNKVSLLPGLRYLPYSNGSLSAFRTPQDCTFTATLFAPKSIFDHLETPQEFVRWFDGQFPDALQLIGVENLLHDVQHNPRSSLIHIKVRTCGVIGAHE